MDNRKVRRRSRQERALSQREGELKRWEGPMDNHPRVSCNISNTDLRVKVDDKIARAKADIANLKGKIGFVAPVRMEAN